MGYPRVFPRVGLPTVLTQLDVIPFVCGARQNLGVLVAGRGKAEGARQIMSACLSPAEGGGRAHRKRCRRRQFRRVQAEAGSLSRRGHRVRHAGALHRDVAVHHHRGCGRAPRQTHIPIVIGGHAESGKHHCWPSVSGGILLLSAMLEASALIVMFSPVSVGMSRQRSVPWRHQ